jgi:hypothetical protein
MPASHGGLQHLAARVRRVGCWTANREPSLLTRLQMMTPRGGSGTTTSIGTAIWPALGDVADARFGCDETVPANHSGRRASPACHVVSCTRVSTASACATRDGVCEASRKSKKRQHMSGSFVPSSQTLARRDRRVGGVRTV